jgi:hypothetical protein
MQAGHPPPPPAAAGAAAPAGVESGNGLLDLRVAGDVAAAVDRQPLDDNPNMPSIELVAEENPEWPVKQNWGMNSSARLFHCFAEVRVRRFTIAKDARANRAELNAGQTPRDRFWSVVYWLYNYGHVSTWFHPVNEFKDTQKLVKNINPDDIDQHRDIVYLKEKYGLLKKTVAMMVEKFQQSGQNCDPTQPWADAEIEGFFKLSGNGGRGNSGIFYAFLLALKHPILQNLVEATLESDQRNSGQIEVDGEVLGSPSASSSSGFLDSGRSSASSTTGKKRRAAERRVEEMCKDMRKHLRMEREMPTMSLQDLVQTMAALHTQLTHANRFVREYEQELLSGGGAVGSDPTLKVMRSERDEIIQQIQDLRSEMKTANARRNAAFVRDNVAMDGGSSSQTGGHSGSDDEEEEDNVAAEAGL